MSNSYYTKTGTATSKNNTARSASVEAEFQLLQDAFDKLPDAIKLKLGTINYAVDEGAANAYVVTFTPAVTELVEGMVVNMKAANTNTATSEIVVDGLASTPIRKQNGTVLSAGDIQSGKIYPMIYNGSYFVITALNAADVETVASLADEMAAIIANETNINLVGSNIGNVNTVGSDIASVNTVATNMSDVQNAATLINGISIHASLIKLGAI